MNKLLLLPVLALSMSACTMMGGTMTDSSMSSGTMASGTAATGAVTYTLTKTAATTTTATPGTGVPTAANLNPMGSIGVTKGATTVMTTATVTGLAPNTYYVAHYHLQGAGGPNGSPCTSNGMAIMASKIVGQTDANGMLKLSGTANLSDVSAATYFNIHTAADASGTPADNGVTCTPVKL